MNEWFDAERHAEQAHRYFEAGLWERALRELRRALAINPDQIDWLTGLALTLDELGRYDDAIRTYQRILSLHGQDVDTLVNMGIDFLRTNDPAQAVEVLNQAVAVDPKSETAWSKLIMAHAQLDEHDRAEFCFYMAV
jgi:Flp pilus assembly protein TadD